MLIYIVVDMCGMWVPWVKILRAIMRDSGIQTMISGKACWKEKLYSYSGLSAADRQNSKNHSRDPDVIL